MSLSNSRFGLTTIGSTKYFLRRLFRAKNLSICPSLPQDFQLKESMIFIKFMETKIKYK